MKIENTSEYNKTIDWQVSKNLIEQRGYLQWSLTHRTQNDNNTTKNDRKDPNVIAGLVRDYAMQTKRVDYDPGGYRRLAAIEGRVYHSTVYFSTWHWYIEMLIDVAYSLRYERLKNLEFSIENTWLYEEVKCYRKRKTMDSRWQSSWSLSLLLEFLWRSPFRSSVSSFIKPELRQTGPM